MYGYAALMKEAAVSYVQEIFQKLKDYEYNESLMQLHFMDGGARIVEAVGEYNWERTHFNLISVRLQRDMNITVT